MSAEALKTRSPNYSATIDGMRFLVCVALALGHYRFGSLFSEQIDDILQSGFASAIFFVLSGFVVVNSSQFWSASWFRSATARISRLWPHHLIAFAVLVPFSLVGIDTTPIEELVKILAVWTLGLQSISFDYAFESKLNTPAWCITGLLIGGMLLPALKKWKFNQFSNFALWTWLAILVAFRIAIELIQGFPEQQELLPRHIMILPRVLAVLAGGVLAILFRRQQIAEAFSWLKTDLAFFAFAFTIFLMLVYARTYHGKEGLYMVAHGGMMIPSLLMVIAAYLNRSSLHRMCDQPWIRKGAELSIYIYLFHLPVSMFIDFFIRRLTPANTGWIDLASFGGILLMLAVTFVVSYLYAPLGSQLQKLMNQMWARVECKFSEASELQSEHKIA